MTPTRSAVALVAAGGALGALARYGLLRAFPVGAGLAVAYAFGSVVASVLAAAAGLAITGAW